MSTVRSVDLVVLDALTDDWGEILASKIMIDYELYVVRMCTISSILFYKKI